MRFPNYTQRLVLIGLILAANTLADLPEEKPVLTIYSDVVGAEDLISEQYTSGIQKTLGAHSENPIFVFNNLCVAYLMSEKMDRARSACIRALKETFISRNYGDWFHRTQSKRVRQEYQGRARAHLKLFESSVGARSENEPKEPAPHPEIPGTENALSPTLQPTN